ncbi:MAG: tungstate ABC transporter substrate-binding protein WtpA [Planctomycetes bacterium]|nr:tungstate ABC transporter substrate-binding protein WtpA [Planctomycetota bacterium]
MSRTAKIVLTLAALSSLGLIWLIAQDSHPSNHSGHESEQLIIFHAGSLAIPFKEISEEFKARHPDVKILLEAAGSRICARKIADLQKPCDVMASSDYTVIDNLLIPEHADWNIKFASNEMVIVYVENSKRANNINQENWFDILLQKNVAFGRSDPNSDPCGYRALLITILAEKFYNRPGLVEAITAKDQQYIRPKEVDLLTLLETGTIDYLFIYRSVAVQHNLKYLVLPDEINLKNADLSDFYKTASVSLTGKQPGTFITKSGEPIIYGVTILKNAPNHKLATAFLNFLLDADSGGAILEKNGQSFVVPSTTETFNKLPESLKIFALPGSVK